MTTLKNYCQSLKNSNVHIIGISGTEGAAIALYLHEQGLTKVILHDFSQNLEDLQVSYLKAHGNQNSLNLNKNFKKLKSLPFKLNLQDTYLDQIETADLIFIPQSWFLYKSNQKLHDLKDKIPFSSITQLYLQFAPCKTIGITGSNGKSTTSALIYHILQNNPDHKTYLTGNDRQSLQLLNQLDSLNLNDNLILETSNRQLLNLQDHNPHIAVLTNISENHIAEHGSYQEYIKAKSKITQFQTPKDHFIYNHDNTLSQQIANSSPATTHTFGKNNSQYNSHFDSQNIYLNSIPLVSLSELPLTGDYNYYNICAATLACHLAGASRQQIIDSLKSFTGLTGRMQKMHQHNHITFYNDRQGTSVDSTVQAINSLPKQSILILGGINKGMSIDPLVLALTTQNTIVIGIDSPFTTELSQKFPSLTSASSLTEAIQISLSLAQQQTQSNILFSPACEYGPYFNPLPQHSDAENFNQIVKNLAK